MTATIKQRILSLWQAITAGLRTYGLSLVAGFLGALASVIVMGFLRLAWGVPSLPELVGERLLPLLPVNLFIKLLLTFAPNSKTAPLGLALLGQLVLGAVLGPLFHRLAQEPSRPQGWQPTRRGLLVAGSMALAMEVVAIVLFWPVLGESLLGDAVGRARFNTSIAMLFVFIAFMGVTLLADRWLRFSLHAAFWQRFGQGTSSVAAEPAQAEPMSGDAQPTSATAVDWASFTRREVIGTAGVTFLAVAGGAVAIDRLLNAFFQRSNLAYEGMVTPPNIRSAITPIEDFYVVSKNVLDPAVLASHWQLELRGLVGQERTWTYDEVRQLPNETRAITLECISNQVGAHLMSTALWQGVTLAQVLAQGGGAQSAGKYVVFTSVDGFQSSLPLADLLEARTLLAWNMNGQTLPTKHGFPLRVIVPGRFGEQSPKWLTRVEVVDQPFKGFYQSQGWSDAQLPTTSRIDLPQGRIPLGPVTVMGIAFAGIRGIKQVEVSADAGQTWQLATLTPPLSDQSWVFWQWTWQPKQAGAYFLFVRATDGTGARQTPVDRGTVPAGATGWDHVKVQVG